MSIEDTAESADSAPTPPGPADRPHGRQRWRRFAAMMVGSAAVAATLVVLTAQGALAASFSISGFPFTVTADEVDGTGFEQFATMDNLVAGSQLAKLYGSQKFLMVAAMNTATIKNLCQSINAGGVYIVIKAGNGTTPVSASTLVLDFDDLTASQIQFNSINIGQDASTLNTVSGVAGMPNILGMQSTSVTITHLRQENYATTASVFTLPDLHMSMSTTGGC